MSTHLRSSILCSPTFSLISKALLQRGSASLYFPRLPYNTAKLFSVAATWQKKINKHKNYK